MEKMESNANISQLLLYIENANPLHRKLVSLNALLTDTIRYWLLIPNNVMFSYVVFVNGRFYPNQINRLPPEPRTGFQATFVRPRESTVLEFTNFLTAGRQQTRSVFYEKMT